MALPPLPQLIPRFDRHTTFDILKYLGIIWFSLPQLLFWKNVSEKVDGTFEGQWVDVFNPLAIQIFYILLPILIFAIAVIAFKTIPIWQIALITFAVIQIMRKQQSKFD